MAIPVDPDNLQESVDLLYKFGTGFEAAKHCDLSSSTIRDRAMKGKKMGMKPQTGTVQSKEQLLAKQIADLKAELGKIEQKNLDIDEIKSKIFKMVNMDDTIPEWIVKPSDKKSSPGVPTLFCSDWHWGEVVFPDQIGNVNAFNLRIAKERIKLLTEKTIEMLFKYMVNPKYPGLVLAFGGDMFSGDIHSELTETQDPMMKLWVSLQKEISRMIEIFLQYFEKIHIIGVVGNHGRTTRKPVMKNRVYTNYDWLLYQQLKTNFQKNKNITWQIPNSTDCLVKVQNHIYLYTHGDQFRGGSGWGGPVQPIAKGQAQKMMRQSQIEQPFDTMVIGHWHYRLWLPGTITNGSLKGYDEYSFIGNLACTQPQQFLWMTKDDMITFFMPLYLTKRQKLKPPEWISVMKESKDAEPKIP